MIFLCYLPLTFSFVFLLIRSIITFCAQKLIKKARHADASLPLAKLGCARYKNSSKLGFHSLAQVFTNALCSRRIMRALGRTLARHSRLSLVCRVLRNALRVAILRKCNCHTAFERPRTMACKQAALRWIFQRCRYAVGGELPLQYGALVVYRGTMVTPIKNRHRQNHS